MKYFQQAISLLPAELTALLDLISPQDKKSVQEIRLRLGKPAVLISYGKAKFLTVDGKLENGLKSNSFIMKKELFERTYRKLCEFSVHSNMNNLVNGFITVKGGHRVGVCSTAVYKNGQIYSVKGVTSLNIRISREFGGISLPLLNSVYASSLPSVIVAGRPGCGKTTVLRDMARQLSSGYGELYRKVAIIDERCEIANMVSDIPRHDVGCNTDVLGGFSKSDGIEIAVRTLSPDLIICDEIGNEKEVGAIRGGFGSGVSFAVSVHISSEKDLYTKPQIRDLLETRQFDYIVLLKDKFNGFEIFKASEVLNEIRRSDLNNTVRHFSRL